MFSFDNEITIDQPIEKVFSFVADLSSVPKWNYFVRSVTPTSDQPGVKGSTYHQIRKNDEQDLRIVRVVENESFIVETIPPSRPAFRREMKFASVGGSTTIKDQWDLDLGVPKLLEPLAASRARNGVMENLRKLKELLENGKTTLQDGRTFTL